MAHLRQREAAHGNSEMARLRQSQKGYVMNTHYLAVDAANVKAEIHRLMEAYPELVEDGELALDMFEGETDLFKVIGRAVKARAEKLAMADGVKTYIGELSERKARMERGADGLKALVQSLMDAAGQDKITLPEATIFVTKPRESVNVTDVDALPQGYFKLTRTADKTALKDALMNGESIPGAELQIGLAGLTIRVK
jgi:hypothetical protein